MKPTALLLLSGGMDSSINLAIARDKLDIKLAITFDYGQKALKNEIKSSQDLAQHYGIEHRIVELPFFNFLGSSSLINKNLSLPSHTETTLDDKDLSKKSAESVWVPNRNGIFINVAAGIAEEEKIQTLIVGFNKEEASTFPDNSAEFLNAANLALKFSTQNKVELICFTLGMDKTQMAKAVKNLNFPWHLIWSCYQSGNTPCGVCESCQRQNRAKKNAEIDL